MPLPADQDTYDNEKHFISQTETQDHPTKVATVAVEKGDFHVLVDTGESHLCGVIEDTAAIGETFRVNVREGIEIQVGTEEIFTGHTFTVKHGKVWYNPTTGDFYNVDTVGCFEVGSVQLVQGSDGMFTFLKHRIAKLSALRAQDFPTKTATAAVSEGDFHVISPTASTSPCGVVLDDAEIGEEFRIDIREDKLVTGLSAEITSEDTFTTKFAKVWWSPSTGLYLNEDTAGAYEVGWVYTVQDGNGDFVFVKLDNAILSSL